MPAQPFQTLWWEIEPGASQHSASAQVAQHAALRLLDQSRLPAEVSILTCRDAQAVAEAIRSLQVRGAPAIGVAAGYGMALGMLTAAPEALQSAETALAHLDATAELLRRTRPTAVNLPWALERVRQAARRALAEGVSPDALPERVLAEAHAIFEEDVGACQRMGDYGAALIEDGAVLLTHCNAGALATAGRGSGLAPITTAHAQGKRLHVFVDETRPVLQGARLTAWELQQAGIPLTLITDNMAAYCMRTAGITGVFVGADRIAANGDVANKIGTYGLAILAREHGIPFYVVAPRSTIDLALASGDAIVIEQRPPDEVTHLRGLRIAPEGVAAATPAFDVTTQHYISAIVTDGGIARPPFAPALARLMAEPRGERAAGHAASLPGLSTE
jgi:methylthioribose-1-phosphate isomerase